jgi:hypothetical protein
LSEMTPIERAKLLLDKFFTTRSTTCPQFVGERACITCDRMDSCKTIERKLENYGNVKLSVAGNSAMLSISFSLKMDIEQFMLEKIVNSLERAQEYPLMKSEEGFDLTFYTKYGQAVSQEQQFIAIMKILDFLSENPWIEMKMLINKWITEVIGKLNVQIRRDLPKVTLTVAPKVERSKIFAPKSETLTETNLEPPIQEVPTTSPTSHSESAVQKVIEQGTAEPTTTSSPLNSCEPVTKTELSDVTSQELIMRAKIPKQSFFLTAEERKNEFANWPASIKRKEFGDKEPSTIEIPSVTEATKKVGPEKPTIPESYIPKGDKFELRIFAKKQAEDRTLPPMPTDDPFKILNYLEQLVKSNYGMRKLAEPFDKGRENIEKTMFYTDFLSEMSKIADMLRKADPELTLNKFNRENILKKISNWKSSPIWKSFFKKEKRD